MKVRVGGGIRTVSRAEEIAGWGASQVIVGSAAFRRGKVNSEFLRRLTKKVRRKQIIIALDTARETSPFTAGASASRFRPKK